MPRVGTLMACGSPQPLGVGARCPQGCSCSIPWDPGSDPTHPCWGGTWGAGWGTEPPHSPPVCQLGARSRPCSGLICGAITSQYLLEKSRVVFQVGGRGGSASSPPLRVTPTTAWLSAPPGQKRAQLPHLLRDAGGAARPAAATLLPAGRRDLLLPEPGRVPFLEGFGVSLYIPAPPGLGSGC